MELLGCNFYKQIFKSYKKIKNAGDPISIEKSKKLIKKAKLAINTHDREHQEVYSAIHEIRFFDFLRQKGIDVIMHSDVTAGPDFECDFGYIECVSITKGQGKNKTEYERIMSGHINRYKAGEPRIASSIYDKKCKYESYLKNKIIDNTKPRIIAVSTSILSNEVHHELSADLIKKVLYGIYTPVMQVQKNDNNKYFSNICYSYNTITRKGEMTFETGYFWKEDFKDVSAVILNHNAFTEDIEEDYFEIYLNPNANTPIDIKKIKDLSCFYLKSKTENNFVFHNVNKNLL